MPNKKDNSKKQKQPPRPRPSPTIRRSRSARTRTRALAVRPPSDVHRLIQSILSDRLISDVHLPAFGNTQPYTRFTNTIRGTLVAGAASESSVVINPWLLWTNQIRVERCNAGTNVAQYLPTALMNGTATPSGYLPEGATNMYTVLTASNRWITDATTAYDARVRPIGIRIRVYYTGTDLNKGGTIYAFHNSLESSLLCSEDSDVTAGSDSAFKSCVNSNTQLAAMTNRVSIHRMGDEFEFIWRPPTFEFNELTTYLPFPETTTLTQANPDLHALGYMAPEAGTSLVNQRCHRGWTTGFKIVYPPGVVAAGTTAPYNFEIDAVYDLNLDYIQTTGTYGNGQAATNSTLRSVHNPVAEAAIHNAVSILAHHRCTNVRASKSDNLGVQGALYNTAMSTIEGAASAFGERVLTSVAAMA